MKTKQHQANKLTIHDTIANFCSQYSYPNFTTQYVNIINVFTSNDLTVLSKNQLDNIVKFLNSVADISLILYWLNDLEKMNDGTLNLKADLESSKFNREHMVMLNKCMRNLRNGTFTNQQELSDLNPLDQLAMGKLKPNFEPTNTIVRFFNKYNLYESQVLSKLLTGEIHDSVESISEYEELLQFQQDLNALLGANFLIAKAGSIPYIS